MKENFSTSNSHKLILTALFVLISCALINSFYIDKHLSADGVHYLTLILDKEKFTQIAWSRQFANYLTQWPLVLAIKLGLKDIPILSKVFGIGIYFPYILSFALCVYALSKEKAALLIFPLISMVSINLSSDYILAGEHHVMVLLTWPILLISLRRQPLNWIDGFLLWVLLGCFSRTYETAIIPAVFFLTIFAVKIYCNRKDKKQVTIHSISTVFTALTFIISLYFIINPRDVANKAGFSLAIKMALSNLETLIAVSFTFLFFVGLIKRKKKYILLSVFPLVIYTFIILFVAHGSAAQISFASRSLSVTLLPLLLISTIIAWYYNVQLSKISIKVFIAFVLIMVLGNLRYSNDWNSFRQQVVQTVINGKGYIPIEKTVIKNSPYGWGWNNTELGIVWSYPCVKAILLNSSTIDWEPFDPRKKLVLKKYIRYDNIFKNIDKNIALCD